MDERIRRIVDGALVAAVEPPAQVELRSEIPYREEVEGGPLLDLYLPRGAAPAGRAAWIFVHGGPLPPAMTEIRAPRSWRFFRDYGALAAASGRIGVVLGHRYESIAGIQRSEEDVRAGVAWVRAHAGELGIAAEQLALWLFSGAGVHLGSLLAVPPSGVRSVVAFYPVVEPEVLAAMGMGAVPDGLRGPTAGAPDPARPPRLFLARAALDHPALNAALDRFVAARIAGHGTVDLATHPAGHHGFELLDDDDRSREIVESALRFLVRCESATEAPPRVVRPEPAGP